MELTTDEEREMRATALHLACEVVQCQPCPDPKEVLRWAASYLEFLRTGKAPSTEGTGGFSPKVVGAN